MTYELIEKLGYTPDSITESGVYLIVHTTSGKVYIGSTVNFKKRYQQHLNSLRKGNHHNQHLQNVWNKYKGIGFQFLPIVLTTAEHIRNAEQAILDSSPLDLMNIANTVYSPGGHNTTQVYQFTMSGNLIRSFDSMAEAANSVGASHSEISRAVSGKINHSRGYRWSKTTTPNKLQKRITAKKVHRYNPINGKYIDTFDSIADAKEMVGGNIDTALKEKRPAGGYLWSYDKKEKVKPLNNYTILSNGVIQYDINTLEKVAEFDSVKEAAKAVGVTQSTLSSHLIGRIKSSGGYIWKRRYPAELNIEEEVKPRKSKRSKPIVAINPKTGKVVAKYASIKEAANNLGVSPTTIGTRLKGKYETFRGLKWKYS